MPTTITKTIGVSSGDYSGATAVQDWYNGIGTVVVGGNLVSSDVAVVGQVTGNLSFPGAAALNTSAVGTYTTDATHTITLTSSTAENYNGGLSWNTTNGPSITSNNTFGTLFLGQPNFILSRLQIQNTGGDYAVDMQLSAATILIDSCILECKGVTVTPLAIHCITSGSIVRNCLIDGNTTNNGVIFADTADATIFRFCTIVLPSDNVTTSRIVHAVGNPSFTNCALFGATSAPALLTGGGAPTWTNCATDFATPPTGTAWQSGLTYANQFNAITIAGGLDWRAKSSGGLKHGIPISGITTDIAGNTRDPTTPYIGAWEVAAAAPAGGKGARLLLLPGSIGWTPSLVGVAAWKAGKAIRRNSVMTRRSLLLPGFRAR